jgi:predicted RNase H-like HicB family nuclease
MLASRYSGERLGVTMQQRELHFTIRNEDGHLWATVDELPGVFATGDDLEELRQSLEEALSLYLAEEGAAPADVQLKPLVPQPVAASASLVSA